MPSTKSNSRGYRLHLSKIKLIQMMRWKRLISLPNLPSRQRNDEAAPCEKGNRSEVKRATLKT